MAALAPVDQSQEGPGIFVGRVVIFLFPKFDLPAIDFEGLHPGAGGTKALPGEPDHHFVGDRARIGDRAVRDPQVEG